MDPSRREAAERILGHRFADQALLEAALTHPSYSAEHPHAPSYERLEFLGDAVVGLIVSEDLFTSLSDAPEGELTVRKHRAVSGQTLSEIGATLGLGALVRMGRGAATAGERHRASVLENVFEALVGALYLDAGIGPATAFVQQALRERYLGATEATEDPKSALQRVTQARGLGLPEYAIVETSGPAHDRAFRAAVSVQGATVAEGTGGSKQAAEKAAAAAALVALARPDRRR